MSTHDSQLAEIGNRLREERERLGLNQALFAGKVGVSRMSQVNYESGKRSPDTQYLRAAAEAGFDVAYVITGKRSGHPDFFKLATAYVLEQIEARTGFAEDVLWFVIETLAEAATSEWLEDPEAQSPIPGRSYDMSQWVDIHAVSDLLGALFENARLLRDIFGFINSALAQHPKPLTGKKRLALVLMLFKTFRVTGEVEASVVFDAVSIAM